MDYWNECISEAFEDAGIKASEEQINTVAGWVEGAHENYGMAFGHDCIPSHYESENEKLKRELKKEQDKVICEACKGRGVIITPGPYHSGMSNCSRCRGDGRHSL